MDRFIKNINKQLEANQNKNLFSNDNAVFQFVNETVDLIYNVDELDSESEKFLIDYATDKALEKFCRLNQYYSFNSRSKDDLRNIYSQLFHSIKLKNDSIDDISNKHYERLKAWLKTSNPFAEKIYATNNEQITPVVCSEYSPGLQLDILGIDINKIEQPVLDIGCGSKAMLVNYLNNNNIEAFGIDRCKFNKSNLTSADWLEYDYGKNKWGTIISHMAFSNHFNHHHLRDDGNYIQYGKTYIKILNSLKIEGSFHYTPSVSFIEEYISENIFSLNTLANSKYEFSTSIIKRIM